MDGVKDAGTSVGSHMVDQELEKYINLRQARNVVAPCRLISEPMTHEANLLDKYHWCENISTDDCGSSSWAKWPDGMQRDDHCKIAAAILYSHLTKQSTKRIRRRAAVHRHPKLGIPRCRTVWRRHCVVLARRPLYTEQHPGIQTSYRFE